MIIDNLLVTGSKDHTIRIYDLITAQLIGVLEGHSGSICSFTSTEITNKYLVSGSDHGDCSIRVWDLQTQ